MTISTDQFRDLLRCFAAGVTVVTAGRGEQVHGLTVSAFASVSTDPPLVAVILGKSSAVHPLLADDGAPFAVNILTEDQAELSDRFAYAPEDERFAAGSWSTATTGAPILTDALAWLDCAVVDRHPAGTHVIYLGRVEAGRAARPEARPLVYWDRDYRRLTDESR